MRDSAVPGPPVSYQTVRLSAGRHPSPQDGVCVMELASMLAHEPFSDRPHSVCPVIGAFLRAYNDRVDDRARQDLYTYAATVVGTRDTADVERLRAQMCRELVSGAWRRGARTSTPAGPPPLRRLRAWLQRCLRAPECAGHYAAIALVHPATGCDAVPMLGAERHRAALRLLDAMIAVGDRDAPDGADPLAMTGELPLGSR